MPETAPRDVFAILNLAIQRTLERGAPLVREELIALALEYGAQVGVTAAELAAMCDQLAAGCRPQDPE